MNLKHVIINWIFGYLLAYFISLRNRQIYQHQGTLAQPAFDHHLAPQVAHAGPHPAQAQAAAGRGRRVRVETLAVVLHAQVQAGGSAPHFHHDLAGPGVPQGVVQQLGHEAVGRRLQGGW